MSTFKWLASFVLAAALVPASQAEPHCPANVPSLTLRLVQSSLIVVAVQANHSGPYDFVVDTGAQVTTVDASLASDLSLKVEGTTGVDGVATSARSAFAHLDLLQAGEHSMPNSLVVIQDLTQLKAADPRIRGILGENFLEHFDILIDNRQHILCLDDSSTLASAIKGVHVELAEPRGTQQDPPFTLPMIVAAHLSAFDAAPVFLRLDSGSNAPVLYASDPQKDKLNAGHTPLLKRVVNGAEQAFAVLPPQDVQVGKQSVRQVSFVVPKNSVGNGSAPREDGLLPTMAFQRVFISSRSHYAAFELW